MWKLVKKPGLPLGENFSGWEAPAGGCREAQLESLALTEVPSIRSPDRSSRTPELDWFLGLSMLSEGISNRLA
jgi:hypothetical protein